jgi:hypothetical protein
LNEKSCPIVLDHVPETARVEGDDRRLTKKCFHRDQAESFVDGRDDDRGRTLIERRKI